MALTVGEEQQIFIMNLPSRWTALSSW